MFLTILIFLIPMILAILIFKSFNNSGILLKGNKILKSINKSHLNSNGTRKQKIRRFKHFPISIPLLDGLYSMYQIRKYGLSVVDDWVNKADPDDIYEFSLGPFSILASRDPLFTHKILTSSDPGHLSKPKFIYELVLVDFLKHGLIATPFEVWTKQRRVISKAFSSKSVQCYMRIINKHCINLAKDLINLSEENEGEVSGEKLADSLQFNIIKITLEFIMGYAISDRDDAMEFTRNAWEYKKIVLHRTLHPELYIPFVWRFHPKRKRMEVVAEKTRAYMRKIIEHYQTKLKAEKDKSTDDPEPKGNVRCLIEEMLRQNASPEEIYNEIGTFLVAPLDIYTHGHETISFAIHQLFHHLACHPEYQTHCREEIDSLMGPYKFAFDENMDLNMDKLSQLEYVERVILESLRITPTVPLTLRELKSPIKIDDDLSLDKGIIWAVCPWITHRDKRCYPEPLKFDPDRHTPEEIAKREKGSFIPFLGGLRNCIGKRFAILELKAVVAWTLRHFEIHTEDGLHDVKLLYEATLRPERPYRTTFKRRNTSK